VFFFFFFKNWIFNPSQVDKGCLVKISSMGNITTMSLTIVNTQLSKASNVKSYRKKAIRFAATHTLQVAHLHFLADFHQGIILQKHTGIEIWGIWVTQKYWMKTNENGNEFKIRQVIIQNITLKNVDGKY